jgi:hypothetical protein
MIWLFYNFCFPSHAKIAIVMFCPLVNGLSPQHNGNLLEIQRLIFSNVVYYYHVRYIYIQISLSE